MNTPSGTLSDVTYDEQTKLFEVLLSDGTIVRSEDKSTLEQFLDERDLWLHVRNSKR